MLKLEPRNVGALGNLGVVYSRTRRYSQAIGVYQAALKVAPRDLGLLTNLGIAYVKQEQFAPAAAIFERLTSSSSTDLQASELLASCRLSLGQYESALPVLNRLMVAEPDNPGVYYMQGIALTELKRKEEAHAAFTRMMNTAKPAEANFLMGKACYETGDFEQAVSFLKLTIAAEPRFAEAHRELGKTLISLRRNEEAERELRAADPADAEVSYFLGALLCLTKPAEAITLLARAQERMPDFWGPLYYLGRIAMEQDRVTDALPLLERAATLKPRESAIQYQLARAYQKQGRQTEAKAAFAKVRELKDKSLRKEIGALGAAEVLP